jgi:hypothetical protein
MNSLKIFLLIGLIFLDISSVKVGTKGSKEKICKKLARPLREIQDLFEAINDVNSSIANHSLDNITKNMNLDDDVENIYLLYSHYLSQFKERVVALNSTLPQSLLTDCNTLLTTIITANNNLEEYKKLAKETQKALNKLMDGDF